MHLGGEGLQPSATATTRAASRGRRARSSTDGPFAETKEQLGGFYLLDCKDLDEALDWAAKRIPMPGGTVEVRPVMDYEARGSRAAQADRGGGGRGRGAATEVADRLFRRESGRAVATLIRILGDFDLAEEAVQEAFVIALERWPRDGAAGQPGRLDRRAPRATARSTACAASAATRTSCASWSC